MVIADFKEAARRPELGLDAVRQDLEIAGIVEVVVHPGPEQRHEQKLALHHDGHRRRDLVGRIGRDDEVHLVDVEELRVDRRHRRRIALVVVIDELDRPAEQAALGIDVITPDLEGEQRALAAAGEAARRRHREPDLDRVRRLHCSGRQNGSSHCQRCKPQRGAAKTAARKRERTGHSSPPLEHWFFP